ncbi:hypothetical protein FDB55_11810 [Clostridium botulinum]|uniref:Rpn family recombination-promoting nuclease/putative transposase n=1 Tax=Clostridium botulinum TaxID=1491 RepID=A0A0C2NTV5_CLOBO|nr:MULTISPECIES: hypothetical protein [Clostridium]ACD54016.1 hypothetical protein CLH_3058 [Clostridium botulinum E3 str. Alaska E43]AJF30862.1 hypothetical protein ST13_14445 [Clostridium botulinum]AJF33925.1 hypothetical protein ST12_14445 [Clostridium botulinum]KAI3348969.1 hypothetical protein CIT18_10910 [Clostridium botulinum]KIL08099.1 hypothetical protein SR42_03320 [Clostridium botulinum]
MESTKSKITLKEVIGMDLAIKKIMNKIEKQESNNELWWKESSLYESANMISKAEKRGEERGKKEKSLEIASKLLLMGLNLQEISYAIGISELELKDLIDANVKQ